jgi:hypothetical protein
MRKMLQDLGQAGGPRSETATSKENPNRPDKRPVRRLEGSRNRLHPNAKRPRLA